MLRLSTGLRNALLGSTGVQGALTQGVIYIYSGAQPASADNAVQGTLLGIVTVGAGAFTHGSPTNGLTYDAPANGVLAKASAETWQFTGVADGTAGWFRVTGNPLDDGSASTTLPRIDGAIAQIGGDLNLSATKVVTGAITTIDAFQLTAPAQ